MRDIILTHHTSTADITTTDFEPPVAWSSYPSPPSHAPPFRDHPRYASPSRHGARSERGGEERPALDAFYETSASRRPKATDVQDVVRALSGLLSRPKIDPVLVAIAAATVELCYSIDSMPDSIRRLFANRQDPNRPQTPFRSARSVVEAAQGDGVLGMSTCSISSGVGQTNSVRVKGAASVERAISARMALDGMKLTDEDRDGVYGEGTVEERILRWRERRLAELPAWVRTRVDAARGYVDAGSSDLASAKRARAEAGAKDKARANRRVDVAEMTLRGAREVYAQTVRDATSEHTDKAIRAHWSKVKRDVETHLRRLPERAEEYARASGDRRGMTGVIPSVRERT
jgi:hypothetical protein